MQPQEYVGIDLHRRRSVIVRRSAEGETLAVSQCRQRRPARVRAGGDRRRRAPRGSS